MTNSPNGTFGPSGDRAAKHFLHVLLKLLLRVPSLFICMQIFKKAGKSLSLIPNGVFGDKHNQGYEKFAIKYI